MGPLQVELWAPTYNWWAYFVLYKISSQVSRIEAPSTVTLIDQGEHFAKIKSLKSSSL